MNTLVVRPESSELRKAPVMAVLSRTFFHIELDLQPVAAQDIEGDVEVRLPVQHIIGIVVGEAGPGIGLPVEVGAHEPRAPDRQSESQSAKLRPSDAARGLAGLIACTFRSSVALVPLDPPAAMMVSPWGNPTACLLA